MVFSGPDYPLEDITVVYYIHTKHTGKDKHGCVLF